MEAIKIKILCHLKQAGYLLISDFLKFKAYVSRPRSEGTLSVNPLLNPYRPVALFFSSAPVAFYTYVNVSTCLILLQYFVYKSSFAHMVNS